MGSFTLRIDATEAQKYRANYWDFTLTGELVDNAHQTQKAKINARLTIDRDDPTPRYLVSWVTVSRDKNREVQTVPGLLAESQTALGNLLKNPCMLRARSDAYPALLHQPRHGRHKIQ